MILADTPLIKKVTTALRKSFPALKHLDLKSIGLSTPAPVIPRRFSAGSAPDLRHVRLQYISFPQLPRLSMSARNLVTLILEDIPATPDISPDDMVRSLTMLTGLTTLFISFYDDAPPDEWQSHLDPPVPARAILPVLTHFDYKGWSDYLEVLLARIDTPRIFSVMIDYFIHDIQASQLSRFIERTKNLKIDQFTCAAVSFYPEESSLQLNRPRGRAFLSMTISGHDFLETQVTTMANVLDELATTFSKVDSLFVRGDLATSEMDITEWMPLFRLFPAVNVMGLFGGVTVLITSALEDMPEEMINDVFPVLRLIWLAEDDDDDDDDDDDEDEDDWREHIGPTERFLSLRQRSGRPVTIFDMESEVVEAEQRQ
jgi:hypothetical protein